MTSIWSECYFLFLQKTHFKSPGSGADGMVETIETLVIVQASIINQIDEKYLKWVLFFIFAKTHFKSPREELITCPQILNRTLTICAQIKLWTITVSNWAINMNVQENRTEKINKINI